MHLTFGLGVWNQIHVQITDIIQELADTPAVSSLTVEVQLARHIERRGGKHAPSGLDVYKRQIQSRAQRIHIRPIETDAIMNAMVSRFGLSPDDAKHVAHLSSGSFIKAMEAISLGEENKFFLEQFKAMMRNSWARNVKGMKAMADVMAGIGRERQKNFLSYCQHLIRENFMYRFLSLIHI